MLTREAIAAYELPREEVELPELGGSVYVRALTGRDFMKVITAVRGSTDDLASLLIPYLPACVIDAAGEPLLDDTAVDRLPFTALAKLVGTLAAVSGFAVDKAVEEGKGD